MRPIYKKTILLLVLVMAVLLSPVSLRADVITVSSDSPTTLAAKAGTEKVSLGWLSVDGAVKYKILMSETQKGGYSCVKTVKASKTACTVNASSDKAYYYKVRAIYTDSQGLKKKGPASKAVCCRSFEKAPEITGVSIGKNGYKIKWTKSSKYDGYIIYRADSSDGTYTKLKTITLNTKKKYTDKKTSLSEDSFYKIAGYYLLDNKKNIGPLSEASGIYVASEDGGSLTGSDDAGSGEGTDTAGNSDETDVSSEASAADSNGGDSQDNANTAVSGNTAVSDNDASHETLVFNTRTVVVGVGQTIKITASSVSSNDAPTYKSMNENFATVKANGTIKGIAAGVTKIRATIGDEYGSVEVRVTDQAVNGIDISKWQGDNVDFDKVKDGGVSFVMLRIAYHLTEDTRFEKYYTAAKKTGLKVGVYCYSMATTAAAAREEAENVLKLLDGRELDYPVAFDLEDKSQIDGLTNAQRTEMILAFKNRIEAAGYSFVLYANLNWLNNYIDNSKLENVNIWIARYRTQSYGHGYTGKGNVVMWQYSSEGNVDGILDAKGKYINIDMNVCYSEEFPITYDPAYDPPAEEETEDESGEENTEDATGTDSVSGNNADADANTDND